MQHDSSIISLFNCYTFSNAAQSVLSALDYGELKNLLGAIEHHPRYQQFAQIIRSRLFICLTETVDRTYYYTHYEQVGLAGLRSERGNLVSHLCSERYLKNKLLCYDQLISKG